MYLSSPERNTKEHSKKRCLEMIELTGLKGMEKRRSKHIQEA